MDRATASALLPCPALASASATRPGLRLLARVGDGPGDRLGLPGDPRGLPAARRPAPLRPCQGVRLPVRVVMDRATSSACRCCPALAVPTATRPGRRLEARVW